MKRKLKFNGKKAENVDRTRSTRAADLKEEVIEWEMRPGGMLVQRRSDNSNVPIIQNLQIRVAYGAARYEMVVNPHATFGKFVFHFRFCPSLCNILGVDLIYV